jgi:hypothetical protein
MFLKSSIVEAGMYELVRMPAGRPNWAQDVASEYRPVGPQIVTSIAAVIPRLIGTDQTTSIVPEEYLICHPQLIFTHYH